MNSPEETRTVPQHYKPYAMLWSVGAVFVSSAEITPLDVFGMHVVKMYMFINS